MAKKLDLEDAVIALGIDPDAPPPGGLTKTDRDAWERIRESVKGITDRGSGIEVPFN